MIAPFQFWRHGSQIDQLSLCLAKPLRESWKSLPRSNNQNVPSLAYLRFAFGDIGYVLTHGDTWQKHWNCLFLHFYAFLIHNWKSCQSWAPTDSAIAEITNWTLLEPKTFIGIICARSHYSNVIHTCTPTMLEALNIIQSNLLEWCSNQTRHITLTSIWNLKNYINHTNFRTKMTLVSEIENWEPPSGNYREWVMDTLEFLYSFDRGAVPALSSATSKEKHLQFISISNCMSKSCPNVPTPVPCNISQTMQVNLSRQFHTPTEH